MKVVSPIQNHSNHARAPGSGSISIRKRNDGETSMAATASCVDRSTVSPFRRANENILPRLSTSVTVARRRKRTRCKSGSAVS